MISGSANDVPINAGARRGVGLWIDINQENGAAKSCDGSDEIDGCSGFADPAFLVSNGDYSGHPAKR